MAGRLGKIEIACPGLDGAIFPCDSSEEGFLGVPITRTLSLTHEVCEALVAL